jgi:hypothetical protein
MGDGTTKRLEVERMGFLLERLAADTPVDQQLRELNQNAIEAIQRRFRSGDTSSGKIVWDIDWPFYASNKAYKLSVTDNGDGMSPDDMVRYLNNLSVQGAGGNQGLTANFGVGAKITALARNPFGLVYRSWRAGQGAMVQLHRDDDAGEYGLRPFNLPDGTLTYHPPLTGTSKPDLINEAGTKVTLLGKALEANTALPKGRNANWVIAFLNSRYFELPADIQIGVRVLTRDETKWPRTEPLASEKTFNIQFVTPLRDLFDSYAAPESRGIERLSNADVYWWVFQNADDVTKKLSTRSASTGRLGVVFQKEVYVDKRSDAARRAMVHFGIVYGVDHVCLYVVPRPDSGLSIRADTGRSRVLLNDEDVDAGDWLQKWGAEFKQKMPKAIADLQAAFISKLGADNSEDARKRVLERMNSLGQLLNPTRYRPDPEGVVFGEGLTEAEIKKQRAQPDPQPQPPSEEEIVEPSVDEIVDPPAEDDEEQRPVRRPHKKTAVFSDIAEHGDDTTLVVPVKERMPDFDFDWVSRAAGTRAEFEMVDTAAELVGDVVTGRKLKINADFRGFRDLLEQVRKEFNPSNDPKVHAKILEHVKDWYATQLVEAILAVRGLRNQGTWLRDDVQNALSAKSLTAVAMCRLLVREKIRASLMKEIGKAKAAA